jgi:hypothetical protein
MIVLQPLPAMAVGRSRDSPTATKQWPRAGWYQLIESLASAPSKLLLARIASHHVTDPEIGVWGVALDIDGQAAMLAAMRRCFCSPRSQGSGRRRRRNQPPADLSGI